MSKHEIHNLIVRLEAMLSILLDSYPKEEVMEGVTRSQMIKDAELTLRELREKINYL